MAPPRASRLAARKSIVPDPALYDVAMSESDEERGDARATRRGDDNNNNKTNAAAKRRKSTSRATTTATATKEATGTPQARVRAAAGTPGRVQQQQHAQPQSKRKAQQPQQQQQHLEDDAHDHLSDSRQTKRHAHGDTATPARAPSTNMPASTTKQPRRNAHTQPEQQRNATESAPGPSSQTVTADDAQQAHTQQRARPGFKPRAALNRAKRPAAAPADAKADGTTAAPESLPFAFNANPPTPRERKRPAQPDDSGGVRRSPRSKKRPREGPSAANAREQEQEQSSSPLSSPRPRARSASAPIHANETPVQVRNIAFRQGDGTPGTAGRSARRTSAKGSGRRGSSIGGGFEAVPHPLVPDNLLYRSTDATEPVARRLRSILSWTTQRRRDQLHLDRQANQDADSALALDIVNQFINDVCESRLDVSVPHQREDAQAAGGDRRRPHPRNESNAAKLAEIEAHYAAISKEQDARDSVKPTYEAFARRAEARTLAGAGNNTKVQLSAIDGLAETRMTTLDDALAFGRRILDSSAAASESKFKRAANRKSKASLEDPSVSTELSKLLADVRLDTAHFRKLSHRMDRFVEVTSAYVSSRSRGTHRALTTQAQQGSHAHGGLSSVHLPSGGHDNDDSSVRTGIATAVGATTQSVDAPASAGAEQRDLLRALAAADSRSRR
ncbi:hypothetical protein ACM66B_004076 [Microbotryomycetes sp. NB124-2]